MSAAILVLNFTGADSRSAAQSITLTGAEVGDTVVFVASTSNGNINNSGVFEGSISVADQIQQGQSGNYGNLSGDGFRVMLVRS